MIIYGFNTNTFFVADVERAKFSLENKEKTYYFTNKNIIFSNGYEFYQQDYVDEKRDLWQLQELERRTIKFKDDRKGLFNIIFNRLIK